MATRFIKQRPQFVAPAGTAHDSVDWARYQEGVPFNFGGNATFHDVCDGGAIGFDVRHPVHLMRRTQDTGASWFGNFSMGDAVLYTDFLPGPLSFYFDTPLRGAGVQIQVKDPVAKFRATIRAFAGNQPLVLPNNGTRNDGTFDNGGGDTAIFVGVLEDDPAMAASITHIEFHVRVLDAGYDGDMSFAINRLDLIV